MYVTVVTHTSFQPVIHHVRQELISRDVHSPQVFRRILPIRDAIVRPTRHFVVSPHDGILVEVDKPPAYSRSDSKQPDGEGLASEPQLPSTRSGYTPGVPLRHEEVNAAGGVHQKTTLHYYPPAVDEEARLRGLTEAVHIGAPEPPRHVRKANVMNLGPEASTADDDSSANEGVFAEANRPATETIESHGRKTRFSIPKREVMPGEFPRPSVSGGSDQRSVVTPWEFAHRVTVDERSDPVERGGHSIASDTGRLLLSRRDSKRHTIQR